MLKILMAGPRLVFKKFARDLASAMVDSLTDDDGEDDGGPMVSVPGFRWPTQEELKAIEDDWIKCYIIA